METKDEMEIKAKLFCELIPMRGDACKVARLVNQIYNILISNDQGR